MCKVIEITMGLLLLAGAIWDLKTKTIPVYLLVLMGVLAVSGWFAKTDTTWVTVLIGAVPGIIFLFVSRITKESIGYGDSVAMLILGTMVGVRSVLEIFLLASFLSGVVALFLMWRRGWNKKTTIPLFPFLALAYGGVVLL